MTTRISYRDGRHDRTISKVSTYNIHSGFIIFLDEKGNTLHMVSIADVLEVEFMLTDADESDDIEEDQEESSTKQWDDALNFILNQLDSLGIVGMIGPVHRDTTLDQFTEAELNTLLSVIYSAYSISNIHIADVEEATLGDLAMIIASQLQG